MIRFAPPALLALSLVPLGARAQTTQAEFYGPPQAALSNVVGGHDLDLDGVPDIVTGARFDNTVAADAGAVYVRSGATGGLLWWRYGSAAVDHFGTSLAMSPDIDGDGIWEVVVGAPGAGLNDEGIVYVLSGRTSAQLFTMKGSGPSAGLGYSVAADFDMDKDGIPDIAGGAPFAFGGQGEVRVRDGSTGGVTPYSGAFANTSVYGLTLLGGIDVNGDGYGDLATAGLTRVLVITFGGPWVVAPIGAAGFSLGNAGDTNGDGDDELLVGDPYNDGTYADSGLVWLAFESGGSYTLLLSGDAPGEHLGQAVAGIGDVDGDGREDWALAATNGVSVQGHVRVLSGKFENELYRVTGSPATLFPSQLAAVGDVTGDGYLDFAVGDPTAGADEGIVAVFSAYGPGFVNYCTPGTSASGCTPTLSATGTPSAFVANPFVLSAGGVEGNTPGLFFYGWNGRQANAWGNGTSLQCVAPPVKRAGLLPAQGTSGQCDGSFSQDLNSHWSGNPGKNPGPGTVCQAQLWYRDPFSTSNQTTSMSDAIEFYVDF